LSRFAPLVLALALAAPAASAASPGCAPTGAKLLESSGAARVYSVGTALYACLGSTRTRLGVLAGSRLAPATRVTRYALASPYVAIDTVQMGVDNFASTVSFFDLEGGGLAVASAPAAKALPRPETFVSVTALVMSAGGIVAWSGRSSAVGVPKPTYELWAMTAEYANRVAKGAQPFTDLKLYPVSHKLTWRTGQSGPLHQGNV